MSRAPELRVGVVGYGVTGKAHCYAYRVLLSCAGCR